MRVADKMQFAQVDRNLTRNRSELANLQNQAAVQKRVLKPSDDPLAATRVLNLRTENRNVEQFIKDSYMAKSFLEYTDQSLAELGDALVRAKELAIGQASDATSNEGSRRVVAAEVEQIFWQTIQVSNRKLGDRYIFGGFNTVTSPFDGTGSYHGDSGDIKIQVNKDTFIPMNLPGDKVFLGAGIDKDGVVRATNETPTTVEELQDEIQREDQERRILEEQKDLAGFEASSSQRSPASIPGKESPEVYGASWSNSGVNIFAVLKKLEIGLRTNDKQQVQDSLDLLDQSISQVILARSQVGSRATVIDNGIQNLQKAKVDTRASASNLEDADAFSIVSDINKAESTLQATLQTSGKLIQPSLLNFLR